MSRKRPREPIGAEEVLPPPAVPVDQWQGCYADGWPKELLDPAAFSHPAKFSYNLIERIYDHARAEGWLTPGTRVLDPFAGVCLGAIHALRLGCSWTGVELEPKFFDIGTANLAKWMHEYRHLPGWGPWAICVNGDSRRLLEYVPAQAGVCVGSPPYVQSVHDHNGIDISKVQGNPAGKHSQAKAQGYGATEGQMGVMPVGLSVSSPPYVDAGTPDARNLHFDNQRAPDGRSRREASIARKQAHGVPDTYGATPGNLANMVVSSPPFTSSTQVNNRQGDMTAGKARWAGGTDSAARVKQDYSSYEEPGNLANLAVSSPPFTTTDTKPHALGTGKGSRATGQPADRNKGDYHYPTSPGQLAEMPVGLAVSSPPYADGCAHTGGSDPKPGHVQGGAVHHVAYGVSEGQMGAMPAVAVSSPPWDEGAPALPLKRQRTSKSPKDHGGPGPQYQAMATLGGTDMAVSSPPYMNQEPSHAQRSSPSGDRLRAEPAAKRGQGFLDATYGDSLHQIGNTNGDTFWSAAHAVVAQTFALLRPGGHAIWVVKAYVRDKKLVDFPGNWRRMCERVGFVMLHEHHAMLIEEHGTQEGLFGEATTYITEKKSFFRRLAEKKGSPKIDFEVVYCMAKPVDEPMPARKGRQRPRGPLGFQEVSGD